jgi:hypothetical protein
MPAPSGSRAWRNIWATVSSCSPRAATWRPRDSRPCGRRRIGKKYPDRDNSGAISRHWAELSRSGHSRGGACVGPQRQQREDVAPEVGSNRHTLRYWILSHTNLSQLAVFTALFFLVQADCVRTCVSFFHRARGSNARSSVAGPTVYAAKIWRVRATYVVREQVKATTQPPL